MSWFVKESLRLNGYEQMLTQLKNAITRLNKYMFYPGR